MVSVLGASRMLGRGDPEPRGIVTGDPAKGMRNASSFLDDRDRRLPSDDPLEMNFQSSSNRLTDNDVRDLASGLPDELRGLDLAFDGCEALTDAGVASLAEALPGKLEQLRLSFADCKLLTDDSLLELTNNLPDALQKCEIDMQNCENITDKGAAFFSADALPRSLSELKLRMDGTGLSDNAKESLKDLESTYQGKRRARVSSSPTTKTLQKSQDEEEEELITETRKAQARRSELFAFAGFGMPADEPEEPPTIEKEPVADEPEGPPKIEKKQKWRADKEVPQSAPKVEQKKAPLQKAAPKVAKQKARAKSAKGKGKSKGKSAHATETAEAPGPSSDMKLLPIGAYVRVRYCGAEVFGRLLWSGPTSFAPGVWFGIDLDEPRTNHDGSVMDVRYFHAKASCGLFALPSAIEPIHDPERNTILGEDSAVDTRLRAGGARALQKSLSTPTLDLNLTLDSQLNSPQGRSRPPSPNPGLSSSPPWSATSACFQEDRKARSSGNRRRSSRTNNPAQRS